MSQRSRNDQTEEEGNPLKSDAHELWATWVSAQRSSRDSNKSKEEDDGGSGAKPAPGGPVTFLAFVERRSLREVRLDYLSERSSSTALDRMQGGVEKLQHCTQEVVQLRTGRDIRDSTKASKMNALCDAVLWAIDCVVHSVEEIEFDWLLSVTRTATAALKVPAPFHAALYSAIFELPTASSDDVRIAFPQLLVDYLNDAFCEEIQSARPGIDTLRTVVNIWEKHKRFSEYMRQLFTMHDREARVDETLVAKIPFSISASAIAAFRKFLRGLWKRKDIGMLQLITAHRKARCTNAEVKLNSDSVFLLRSFLEMLVVLGFTMSKEFYRLSHFIDQDILRQRGRFVATNNIELLQPPCAEMYDNIYLGSDRERLRRVRVDFNSESEAVLGIYSSSSFGKFIHESSKFFMGKGPHYRHWFKGNATLIEYMKHVQLVFEDERWIGRQCLLPCTWKSVKVHLIHWLIANPQHQNLLLDLGGDGHTFDDMLWADRRDDLKIVFVQLKRAQKRATHYTSGGQHRIGITPLVVRFANFCREQTNAMCCSVLASIGQTSVTGEATASSPTPSPFRATPQTKDDPPPRKRVRSSRTRDLRSKSIASLPNEPDTTNKPSSCAAQKAWLAQKQSCPQPTFDGVDAGAFCLRQLLDVSKKMRGLIRDCFMSSDRFTRALNEVLEKYLNKFPEFDAAKELADCSDRLLRRNSTLDVRHASESKVIKDDLMAVVHCFGLLWNKDKFQALYVSLLQARLLGQRDVYDFRQEHNAEQEKYFLRLLQDTYSPSFTASMYRMIEDVVSAESLVNSRIFANQLKETDALKNCGSSPPTVGVHTLTRSAWPPWIEPGLALGVSEPLRIIAEQFDGFYAARHPTRRLTRHWHLTKVVLKASFPAPSNAVDAGGSGGSRKIEYEFHMSGVQATLLNAFRKRRKTGLCMDDFAAELGFAVPISNPLHRQFVGAVLATFTFQGYRTTADCPVGCSRQFPLVNRRPNSGGTPSDAVDVPAADTFSLNRKFQTAGGRRVFFRAPVFVETPDTLQFNNSLEEQRRLTVAAACVRVMKSRGTCSHALLRQEVAGEIASFRLSKTMFKDQVQYLLNESIIQRSEDDATTYEYIT